MKVELAASLLWAATACVAPPETLEPRVLERGMVVCEHELAAQVGRTVLEQGGTAVDAAVATALALAVVYPQAGNLGGGGFALVVDAAGRARCLDFRECAPAGASGARVFDAEGVRHPDWLLWSPHAVGVPGSPAGLALLLEECGSGRFTLAQLCAPAIDLAERGFAVDGELHDDLCDKEDRARLLRSAAARERFYPRGAALERGDVLVQRDLAQTLRRYANEGAAGFYGGATAASIVAELERAALALPEGSRVGWVTLDDLRGYRALWREPLRAEFRAREVISMPPPSSGGIIVLQTLALLERLAPSAKTFDAEYAHWAIEAWRRAFAERAAVMGDPGFVEVPVDELLSARWLDRAHASMQDRATPEVQASDLHEGSNTTHLSVVDAWGNAVALTTTLNSSFGSGMLVEGAGFLLNNELDDFALGDGLRNQFGLVGGAANAIEPGKRPLSSMTPTVVRRAGRVELVLGSPGGPRIVTSVAQVLLRCLVFDEPLESAVRAPRLHQQWSPAETWIERGWPAEFVSELRGRGHELDEREQPFGRVQAIRVAPDGSVEGASDPRGGGAALGTRQR